MPRPLYVTTYQQPKAAVIFPFFSSPVFFPLCKALLCFLKGSDITGLRLYLCNNVFLLLACGFVSSILSKGFTGQGHNMNLSLSSMFKVRFIYLILWVGIKKIDTKISWHEVLQSPVWKCESTFFDIDTKYVIVRSTLYYINVIFTSFFSFGNFTLLL